MSCREKEFSFLIGSDTGKQNQMTKRKCLEYKEWGAALTPVAGTMQHKALNLDSEDQGWSAQNI